MAYPKQPRQENPNAEYQNVAPIAPEPPVPAAPQAPSATGGAPRLNQQQQQAPAPGRALSQRQYFQGRGQDHSGGRIPTPSPISMMDAGEQLKDLSGQVKQMLDQRFASLSAEEKAASMFWRTYEQMPEPMATMVARRRWLDQMQGRGPVADFMAFVSDRR